MKIVQVDVNKVAENYVGIEICDTYSQVLCGIEQG